MSWEFHVGQQVVCVDGDGFFLRCARPVMGMVYTIRWVEFSEDDNCLGLGVEEITNPIHHSGREYGYRASRFRPVKPTSIECFRHLLAPRKEEELA